MLNKKDFVVILGDLERHLAKTIAITDGLIAELDDPDMRLRFVALRQTKHVHLETMRALAAVLRDHVAETP